MKPHIIYNQNLSINTIKYPSKCCILISNTNDNVDIFHHSISFLFSYIDIIINIIYL